MPDLFDAFVEGLRDEQLKEWFQEFGLKINCGRLFMLRKLSEIFRFVFSDGEFREVLLAVNKQGDQQGDFMPEDSTSTNKSKTSKVSKMLEEHAKKGVSEAETERQIVDAIVNQAEFEELYEDILTFQSVDLGPLLHNLPFPAKAVKSAFISQGVVFSEKDNNRR